MLVPYLLLSDCGKGGDRARLPTGRGGRWRLRQPSLHQSVRAGLAVVIADKGPHLCEASAETVKGSIKIKTDKKNPSHSFFFRRGSEETLKSFPSWQTGGEGPAPRGLPLPL